VGDCARRTADLPVLTDVSSITEVARLAGVSTATASRVLSAADYAVAAATRERVLDAARALDYVPNALARGLLSSRVPVVGVIVHDITDPYFAEVVRGVEDAAASGGYLVITCSSDRIAARESSYVRLLRSMRAAAVIFAGSGLDDPALDDELGKHVSAMRGYGAAVVHLSPHARGEPEVGVDNAAGIAAMVGALVRLGHRRIAFLAGPTSLYVARDRLAGYRRGLADAGLALDGALVVHTRFDREGGAVGVDALLAEGGPFTAICCANDLLALGALERLAGLGIDVPGDVSVAGFDDIQVAAMTAPSLSTVRLPLRDMGRRAFHHVDRLLDGERPRREVLPTTVVMRGSTGRPPAVALRRGRGDTPTIQPARRRLARRPAVTTDTEGAA
jgi:LacI family transcriptional regulator